MNNPTTSSAGVDQLAESELQQQRGRQRQEPLGAHPGPPPRPGRPAAGGCGDNDHPTCVILPQFKFEMCLRSCRCLPETGLP